MTVATAPFIPVNPVTKSRFTQIDHGLRLYICLHLTDEHLQELQRLQDVEQRREKAVKVLGSLPPKKAALTGQPHCAVYTFY